MESPVSLGRPATVLMDTEFEEVKKIMKEGANDVLDKTSAQAKDVFKKQAEVVIEKAVGCVTTPSKTVNQVISPEPVANIANQSIDACGAPISKKVANQSVDKCVDIAAKKVVSGTIDYSVDSSKSFLMQMYNRASAYFLKKEEAKVEQIQDTTEDTKETTTTELKD